MKFLIPRGIAKGDFMKKKLTMLIALIACGSLLSAATTYSTILSSAKANSPQMQNAELTYQNSLLTQQQNDLDDEIKVTVKSGTVSVLPAKSFFPMTGRQRSQHHPAWDLNMEILITTV